MRVNGVKNYNQREVSKIGITSSHSINMQRTSYIHIKEMPDYSFIFVDMVSMPPLDIFFLNLNIIIKTFESQKKSRS